MSSRAKKKRKSKGLEPSSDPAPHTSDWEGEEGIPLTKRQERWVEMFFGVLVFFGGGAYAGIELLGSWIAALVFGVIGAILAVVLIRRGETLF